MSGDEDNSAPSNLPAHPTVNDVIVQAMLGLPDALARSAIGAINRLITGVADIPATWLAGYKEAIEDKNYEHRELRRGLAVAARERAVLDTELVERTLHRILFEQSKKQKNREAIGEFTAEEISKIDDSASNKDDKSIDDDWLDKFSSYAENVNTEDAQKIWAKLLSKEIMDPGTFPISSLRIMSEMSKKSAENFQKILDISMANIIPRSLIGDGGRLYSDAKSLEEIGLLSGVSGTFSKPVGWGGSDGVGGFSGRSHFLQIKSQNINSLKLDRAIYLTDAGVALSKIIDQTNDREVSKAIIGEIGTHNIDYAILWSFDKNRELVHPPEILHTRDAEAIPAAFR